MRYGLSMLTYLFFIYIQYGDITSHLEIMDRNCKFENLNIIIKTRNLKFYQTDVFLLFWKMGFTQFIADIKLLKHCGK